MFRSNPVMVLPPRIIGTFDQERRGPLVLVIGGMHGNEPAGVEALATVFSMLALEPVHNRSFRFRGKLIGLRGNRRALAQHERYLEKDLNRQWTPAHVAHIQQQPHASLSAEDLELKELLETIDREVRAYRPKKLVILDLHTTTATGGIFSIPIDNPGSIQLATEMLAPVVTGLLSGISGTLLQYFTSGIFPCQTLGLAFESGQHDEPLSAKRAVSVIINLLRGAGCVRPADVETKHDDLLQEYSIGLPAVTELLKVHHITANDAFRMHPGYQNFQRVKKGECLAEDRQGSITADEDSYILMPLYQKQGEDGFFLIKSIEL